MSKIVDRTLDLLELFGQERRPLTLSDTARLLKIPVSSCHDVVQALQARGYLYELAPRAGYYPTSRLLRLGKEISEHDPVAARAEIVLRSMRDSLDETVLLAKVNGLQATYLIVFEPTQPLRFLAKVGDNVRTLHATSGGKALLGSLDDHGLTDYLRTARLTAMTARTITSKSELRADIERGRQRGWHENNQESLEGVTTLSASFRWNASVYIVTVAGPTPRMTERFDKAVGMLTHVCTMLEMRADAA
jgi:DNA-binding IclR family transcriptional regulator